MIKKLSHQLFASFLFFIFLIIILIILSVLYIKRKDKIEHIYYSIQEINTLVLEHNLIINNFFTYDTKSQQFFKTGHSSYLEQHEEKYQQISDKVKSLHEIEYPKSFEMQTSVNQIKKELDLYNKQIENIVALIIKRGFQDFGTEGEMRNYIHKLENLQHIDLSKVLMLRRHEKDYIIRNQKIYIEKLLRLAESFKEQIASSPEITESERDSALHYLDNYVENFKFMVTLDQKIGIKDNTALRKKITNQEVLVMGLFNELQQKTTGFKKTYFLKLKQYYSIVIIVLLSLSFFLNLFLSKRITYNLSLLSENISSFVQSNFNESTGNKFPEKYTRNEVGMLIDHYKILRQEIIALVKDFQKKLDQRTYAITYQNERLEQQKEEIETQRDELFKKNQLIESQKQIAEQKNKDILASIEYARYIQDALLPSEENMNRYFANYFVLYKPKDIISGDFYWTKSIKNEEFFITLLAIADCTGHGVPGAMMSMLGVALLNEIVLNKEVRSVNAILDKLREKVIDSFHDQDSGMDIGIILLDHKTNTLHFSGANRPMYFIRNNQLSVIHGDRMPVGKYRMADGHFHKEIISIRKNDTIYLFSDGYTDQFGGPKNKKFKRQPFKDLLVSIQDRSMAKQKDIIELAHKQWKGLCPQTDDITVIGIKF
jgi:serine phosphatase RsbU (regulator of sigma subunit)